MPKPSGPPKQEFYENGVIDKLLGLRNTPLSPELLAAPDREGALWEVHRNAVDAALDIVVPALQKLIDQSPIAPDVQTVRTGVDAYQKVVSGHEGCFPAEPTRKILGHVPRFRGVRGGWL